MSKTVVVIENDPDTLHVICEVLSGLDVRCICRSETLEMPRLKKLNPSLIIVDHWLNDGLGSDYCKKVKADPETSNIPVIMMSAVNSLGAVADEALADGIINKPFDIDHLEEIVKHYTM